MAAMLRRTVLLTVLVLLGAGCASEDGQRAAPVAPPTVTPLIATVTEGPAAAAPVAEAPAPEDSAGPSAESGVAPEVAEGLATPEDEPPARLTQLTESGCCVGPAFSADGQTVLYIDQPAPGQPVGIYGVGLAGGDTTLYSARIGDLSPDGHYLAYMQRQEMTVVENRETGSITPIRNGGRRVAFSPGVTWLAWNESVDSGNFDQRPSTVWVADLKGENAQAVAERIGGGLAGWLDEEHLLLSGAPLDDPSNRGLDVLSLADGSLTRLISSRRIRMAEPSPSGEWIALAVALDTDDPDLNGMWVISADGETQHRLPVDGGMHWRDGSRLLVVPLEMGAESHRLLEFDAERGEMAPLTDPAVTPFRIFAGDWKVSPTGEHVVFVNAADQAIWLLELPDAPAE